MIKMQIEYIKITSISFQKSMNCFGSTSYRCNIPLAMVIACFMPWQLTFLAALTMLKCDPKFVISCDFPSVQAYLEAMRQLGTWGDAITANAFCIMYDVNVTLFTPDGISELYPGDGRSKIGMVLLGGHYSSTTPI
jgi:hypothetical protein